MVGIIIYPKRWVTVALIRPFFWLTLGSIGWLIFTPTSYGDTRENTLLNSDQIMQKFGSYGVEVLTQSDGVRLANLYSRHDQLAICRTLAVTRFHEPTPPSLAEADSHIRQGESIGMTLKEAGWSVDKHVATECLAPAGKYFEALTAGTVPRGTDITVRVYTLRTTQGQQSVDYAAIAEAYHPAHITSESSQHCTTETWQRLSELEAEALSALLKSLDKNVPS